MSEPFFYRVVNRETGEIQSSYQRDYRYQTYYDSKVHARRQRFDDAFTDKAKYKVQKFKLVLVEED